MDFLYHYGLFLAQAVTLVVAIIAVIIVIAGAASKTKPSQGEVEINDISTHMDKVKQQFEQQLLSKEQLKTRQKQRKQAEKTKSADEAKPHLFVIDFKGSMDAHETESLREEITALLTVANKQDEVLIKVDSGGGVVHGYGLAASQMMRLKQANIPMTVAIDKIAASGGYMMACVADKIIAAPFAIVGSIGVMAQIPNFSKVLKKLDVDYEMFTAGEYKRTVTMFGENNEKGREKFKQELEETHVLFKDFVGGFRPSLDIDGVATGEHWYGSDALKKGLVDHIQTSDDYLMAKLESHKIVGIKCIAKKSVVEKLGLSMSIGIERLLCKWWQQGSRPLN